MVWCHSVGGGEQLALPATSSFSPFLGSLGPHCLPSPALASAHRPHHSEQTHRAALQAQFPASSPAVSHSSTISFCSLVWVGWLGPCPPEGHCFTLFQAATMNSQFVSGPQNFDLSLSPVYLLGATELVIVHTCGAESTSVHTGAPEKHPEGRGVGWEQVFQPQNTKMKK